MKTAGHGRPAKYTKLGQASVLKVGTEPDQKHLLFKSLLAKVFINPQRRGRGKERIDG